VQKRANISPLILAIFIAACGYHLVGTETHLPPGVNTIAVDIAQNKTEESGLEQNFTQELILAIKSDGRIKIDDRKNSQAILRSELTSVSGQPISYDKFGRASLIQVTLTARVYLVQAQKELWSSGAISESEQYPEGDDFLANDRLRNQALVQAGRRISRIAIEQLASGF